MQPTPRINLLDGGMHSAVAAAPSTATAVAPSSVSYSVPAQSAQEESTHVPIAKPAKSRQLLIAGGILLFLGIAGAGGYLAWQRINTQVVEAPNEAGTQAPPIGATTPSQLSQTVSEGAQVLEPGQAVNTGKLTLSFSLGNATTQQHVVPQVEVVPVGTDFTGAPTVEGASTEIKSQTTISVPVELADGSYHWQARVMSDEGAGEWVSFGENPETEADFIVDSTAPSVPVIAQIAGESVGTAKTVTTDSHTPTLSGTAEPNAKISITTSPQTFTLSTSADQSGNWTATPLSEVASGSHNLTVTATDTAGNSSTSTLALLVGSANAEEESSNLAATGQPTDLINLISAITLGIALLSLVWVKRHAN